MNAFVNTVAEITRWLTIAMALNFFVGLVINMAQAHVAYGTGDSLGYARALQQAIAMVVLLAVAASAESVAGVLAPLFRQAGSLAPSGAVSVWKVVAQFVINTIVGGAFAFTAVSAMWSVVSMQSGYLTGSHTAVSQAAVRVIGTVLGGIGVVVAIWLANAFIAETLF